MKVVLALVLLAGVILWLASHGGDEHAHLDRAVERCLATVTQASADQVDTHRRRCEAQAQVDCLIAHGGEWCLK